MERRDFLKGMLMAFGAAAAGISLAPSQAAAATTPEPALKPDETSAQVQDTEATVLDDAEKDSDGQFFYRSRPRRIYRRPRRVFFQRRVYRRPRRVFFRPRRVIYRRYW